MTAGAPWEPISGELEGRNAPRPAEPWGESQMTIYDHDPRDP